MLWREHSQAAIRLLCLSKTPFGVPVEPDVYMMQNRSSGVGLNPPRSLVGFALPRAFSCSNEIALPPRLDKMSDTVLITP